MSRAWRDLSCLAIVLCAAIACGGSPTPTLTIAAASSLRTVLPDLIRAAPPEPHVPYATYAASGVLRQQVEAGAPVDVMIFAAAQPIDRLIASGYADAGTRSVLATNQLVLVTPRGGPALSFQNLTSLSADSRLAIGDPRTVPVGRYAREALARLHAWQALRSKLVFGANVAAVLAYARRGEVDGAFVYATDARTTTDVVVSDRARGDWAPTPLVVAALRPGAPIEARRFLDFLLSEQAQTILRAKGFGPPPGDDHP